MEPAVAVGEIAPAAGDLERRRGGLAADDLEPGADRVAV